MMYIAVNISEINLKYANRNIIITHYGPYILIVRNM